MYVPTKLRKKIDWLFRRAEGTLLPEALRAGVAAHLDPDGARLALRAVEDEVAVAGESARLEALCGATSRDAYVARYGVAGVRTFTAGAARIHRLEVETFPRHVNNVYLVVEDGRSLLVDCGSSLPSTRRDLELAFAILRDVIGEDVRWEDLDACLVTHAHADHYGGLNHLRATTKAKISAHALDARVLRDYEARFVATSRRLDAYWRSAGVPEPAREAMGEMYTAGKRLFRAESVDRDLEDGDRLDPGYRVHHVPGHCPGLVCLDVNGVLLTSDHVLARITPHQFPQAITPYAGLAHYFRSLDKIRALPGITSALGGHEEAIADLPARIGEIRAFHERRLERVLAICDEPRSVHEVASALFGEQDGYGPILAIDEAGAHVELLADDGRLEARQDGEITRYVRSARAAG